MLGKRKKRRPTKVNSLIGRDSTILGNVEFTGGLHVDGVIKGNVNALGDEKATLTLSDRGTIEGEVRVCHIILNGVVNGDVYAREYIELSSQARVEGNVFYGLIEMAMGAEVNGQLVRIAEEERTPMEMDETS